MNLAQLNMEALHIVGLSYLRLGDFTQATIYLEKAALRNPLNGHVYWRLGQALQKIERHEDAVIALDHAESLGITDKKLVGERFFSAATALKKVQINCKWSNLERLERICRQGILSKRWVVGEAILASSSFSNAILLRATKNHSAEFLANKNYDTFVHRAPGKIIRLGFVGSDFFEQATSYLMNDFIAALDREKYEISAYDYGSDRPETKFRKKTMGSYDNFTVISQMSDEAAAKKIHDDEIDILFSIKNPGGARLGIFMRRPAAIQVHYLYYPGTSGMPFFDYIVADDVVIPPGMEDGYSEKVVRISGCYQPNDGNRVLARNSERKMWNFPESAIVMGNFNQTYKISPSMFDLWCLLLREDSNRILWLLCGDDNIKNNLRQEAKNRGISPTRLFFAEKMPLQNHFDRLRQVDLVLDTFPYGGHTLTSDALWAGTPVLTLCGETFSSRVAASLLKDVGMSELITYNELEYLRKANEILSNSTKLSGYRKYLDERRKEFSLFNPDNYARRFEDMVSGLLKSKRISM